MRGTLPYLYATSIPILVALVGVLGNRWLAGVRGKAAENEQRLRAYEGYDHTYANLRADYDRVTVELAEQRAANGRLQESLEAAAKTMTALRTENNDKDRRISRVDRQLERLLEAKEEP